MNTTDEAVKGAGERLQRLNEVSFDHAKEVERVRFAIRDAQRLAMAGRATPDPRHAGPLDQSVERVDRAVAGLTGPHPDYWHFLTELDAVKETVQRRGGEHPARPRRRLSGNGAAGQPQQPPPQQPPPPPLAARGAAAGPRRRRRPSTAVSPCRRAPAGRAPGRRTRPSGGSAHTCRRTRGSGTRSGACASGYARRGCGGPQRLREDAFAGGDARARAGRTTCGAVHPVSASSPWPGRQPASAARRKSASSSESPAA